MLGGGDVVLMASRRGPLGGGAGEAQAWRSLWPAQAAQGGLQVGTVKGSDSLSACVVGSQQVKVDRELIGQRRRGVVRHGDQLQGYHHVTRGLPLQRSGLGVYGAGTDVARQRAVRDTQENP